ncbi:hypothetical protein LTR60_002761 [Cryomyces antarcticus]|nr:hypothetical protein LTR60_002761 [Cryomyces antarcticus]
MSAYRSIAPSRNNDNASGAAGLASGSVSGSETGRNAGDSPPRGKKRRAPSHVSQNACTNCKKARAKCDGNEPAPCSRCVGRNLVDQCHYEVHVKTVKEEMVRRIKNIEQRNTDLQGSMKEKDLWIESIFQSLMRNEHGPEAVERLRQGYSYQQLADWLGQPPIREIDQLSPTSESKLSDVVKKYERAMNVDNAPTEGKPSRWTDVTKDEAVTHHLMALFFAWIHPVHMLFSERHFISSFRKGENRYCTSAMVNVICAMGCVLLVDHGGDATDSKILAARFVEEVNAQIVAEDRKNPNFAVTYAILFLVESSSGQARKASSHLRLAVESLRGVDTSNYSAEALELSFWGIHTLDTAWAAFTYQKPSAPISPHAVVFENVEMDRQEEAWKPYRFRADGNDPALALRPSHAIRTAKELAQLYQIIHETITVYCGSKGKVTARSILSLYQRYLQWRQALPSELRWNEVDPHSLPHVFYIHVTYHVALCHLFQPLLVYRNFSHPTRVHLQKLVLRNAREGIGLLQKYNRLFSNRYQPPLQAFCLVHLCEALLRSRPANAECYEAITFCLEMLREALPGFLFLGPMQAMFCQTVVDNGFLLPKNVHELMGGRTHYGPEDLLDACERTTFTQPIDMLLDRLDPTIENNFEDEWKQFIEQYGASTSDNDTATQRSRSSSGSTNLGSPRSARSMHINALVNP